MSIRLFFLLFVLSGTADRESLRFEYCAEQNYDTSCGLTAIACLLDKYWGVPADEISLAEDFFADKIAGGNFTISFADMAAILEAKGFSCKAYRMTYAQLEKAVVKYTPVIVHYDRPDSHFALALAIREGEILIADPAEGTAFFSREYFGSRWSGKVLVADLSGRKVDAALLKEAESSAWGRRELLDQAALAGTGNRQW
ncbi:MAG: cysteine peptidase family C39 domain-containing protein [Spirochaetes bacterium]|nr:cysteine peptidase family C39 domain-containing protein [Spirochaetota bacterium]